MLSCIKKITSLLMAVVFVLLVFVPASVSAQEVALEESLGSASQNALYSVRGAQTSKLFRESLKQFDINIENDTLIEVVSCGQEDGTTALVVTQQEKSLVKRSVLVAYGEDGEVQPISASRESTSSSLFGFGDEIDPFNNGNLVVVYAVLYNRYISNSRYCYQPIHAQMMYKNDGNYSVSKIGLDYKCYGFELNYPSFVDREEPYVLHRMQIDETNPVKNRYYVNTNAYRTDRVLCVNPGPGYHSVTYSIKINGNTSSWTDHIPLEQQPVL